MMIGERIKEIRKQTGKTQQAFADAIGLKRNTIANYEIGQVHPSDRTIADICRVFGVSEVWLRTGDGEMFLDSGEDTELTRALASIQLSGDELIRDCLIAYCELNENEKAAVQKLLDGIIRRRMQKAG